MHYMEEVDRDRRGSPLSFLLSKFMSPSSPPQSPPSPAVAALNLDNPRHHHEPSLPPNVSTQFSGPSFIGKQPLPLLPGEKLHFKTYASYQCFQSSSLGTLHITNYRVLFRNHDQQASDAAHLAHLQHHHLQQGILAKMDHQEHMRRKSIHEAQSSPNDGDGDDTHNSAERSSSPVPTTTHPLSPELSATPPHDTPNPFTHDAHNSIGIDLWIPIHTIYRIEKTITKRDVLLELYCKDFRTLCFSFVPSICRIDKVEEVLKRFAFPPNSSQLFATAYKLALPPFHNDHSVLGSHKSFPDMPSVDDIERMGIHKQPHAHATLSSIDPSPLHPPPFPYDCLRELKRLGVPDADWRVSSLNKDYKMSDTYPPLVAVPSASSDKQLQEVADFRSKGRIPVFCWRHSGNGVALARSSQPRVGWGFKRTRSRADESLMSMINSTNSLQPSSPMFVMDCRPRVNAVANQAMGAGYENSQLYEGAVVEFLGIENIHVMRESLIRLRELIMVPFSSVGNSSSSAQADDMHWYSRLESTKWLEHVLVLLTSATRVADTLEGGSSVLVHCSDGWDRTSQVASLAMLMLDPYYRTLEGFAVLVEKEWVAMGHKFHDRIGHGLSQHSDPERSPIFHQWIDCVWQIMSQFPNAFEFNECFLIYILDCLYDCRFGNFLENCEKLRERHGIRSHTASMWSWACTPSQRPKYTNLAYAPQDAGAPSKYIQPVLAMKYIRLWEGYYLRWTLDASSAALGMSGGSPIQALRAMEVAMLRGQEYTSYLLRALDDMYEREHAAQMDIRLCREKIELNEEVKKILRHNLDQLQVEKDNLVHLLEGADVDAAKLEQHKGDATLEMGSAKAQRMMSEWAEERATLRSKHKVLQEVNADLKRQLQVERERSQMLARDNARLEATNANLIQDITAARTDGTLPPDQDSEEPITASEGDHEAPNKEDTGAPARSTSQSMSSFADLVMNPLGLGSEQHSPASYEDDVDPVVNAMPGFKSHTFVIPNYTSASRDHVSKPVPAPGALSPLLRRRTQSQSTLALLPGGSSFSVAMSPGSLQSPDGASPPAILRLSQYMKPPALMRQNSSSLALRPRTYTAPDNLQSQASKHTVEGTFLDCIGCNKRMKRGQAYKSVFGAPHCLPCAHIVEVSMTRRCYACGEAFRDTTPSIINGEAHCTDCVQKITQKMDNLGFDW